ncbi:unnamed protein product, partial [Tetraodon nigroviridis]
SGLVEICLMHPLDVVKTRTPAEFLQRFTTTFITVKRDSRSKGEAVTLIVTRAWVIASGPSSATRGRFFPQRLFITQKKKKKKKKR